MNQQNNRPKTSIRTSGNIKNIHNDMHNLFITAPSSNKPITLNLNIWTILFRHVDKDLWNRIIYLVNYDN